MINFTQVDELSSTLSRPALVFIEGEHTDATKRTHFFTRQRVQNIVENTNAFFRQGRRIPFQLDHKKDQLNNIGDVQSEFYTRVIEEKDLPDPNHKHLIGKLGVFVDNVVARGKDVVQKIIDKNIRTLSPGIDPATESFIEISATPVPAIIGPSLYSQNGEMLDNVIEFQSSIMSVTNNTSKDNSNSHPISKAFSFKDLEKLNEKMGVLEGEYKEIANGLFKILSDIKYSSEEELAGVNPIEASYDALETFIEKIESLFKLTEESNEDAKTQSTFGEPRVAGTIPTTSSVTSKTPSQKAAGFSRNTKKTIGFYRK
jgi:hypothetical protein